MQACGDPRSAFARICELFLKDFGERFRRTAAARNYHHARRGGLVEHTAQMMRVALALGPLYPQLNLDLLLAGILFHDSGKLWENHLPEDGFTMGFDERGELMGTSRSARAGQFPLAQIADGGKRTGLGKSGAALGRLPVTFAAPDRVAPWRHAIRLAGYPKTPEAMTLHYIDNLDARLEMFAAGYLTAKTHCRSHFRSRPAPAGNLGQIAGEICNRFPTGKRGAAVPGCGAARRLAWSASIIRQARRLPAPQAGMPAPQFFAAPPPNMLRRSRSQ